LLTDCIHGRDDRPQLTNDPFLEKNLEFMIECTDEFSNEQYTYQSYQRQLIKQQQQQQLYLAKRVRVPFPPPQSQSPTPVA